jgi:hypothetical protein
MTMTPARHLADSNITHPPVLKNLDRGIIKFSNQTPVLCVLGFGFWAAEDWEVSPGQERDLWRT